ncbi:NAD(P)/FAD-dependent oxidoreductase [Streptomyces cylindrosporus]|uniref:NAD(P)/FAD-dependent oxidoreductase n=1 Tax=Streptomyces cylindrosporus TaxID=2927583 RepID=A0ABS9XXV7_9ACTN|nr:FAD-dependent oxidoreductase [Streptomyces cylindrosporus]MCI3269798.1 NAD(P)/FAD-dependent oxidoreductase [Streptomyces cylindrosporus]
MTYDVGVIGGGFAGPVLAAALARNGVRTLLLESRPSPGFRVGETLVPYASSLLRAVARRYDVPEVEALGTLRSVERDVSQSCGVMRNMGFVLHREGLRQHPGEVYQVVNPKVVPDPPHLFRADTDAYLLDVARHHGADVRTGAEVTDVRIEPGAGARLRTADGADLDVRYVVDAAGHRSPLARELGLREEPPALRHRSRAFFTHMTGVLPYDRTPAGRLSGQPSPWHEGTLHHVFDGGWIWVIPFGNQRQAAASSVCSVGVVLRETGAEVRSPEREFAELLARFPDIGAQFEHAAPVRPWTSAPRLQYSSRSTAGEGYCLLGHAAGFVDPLYSRGLAHGLEVVGALARPLIDAARDGDWSAARFRPVEDLQRALLTAHDDLTYASFVAFRDYDLFNAVVRVWTLSTVLGALAVENACAAYAKSGDEGVFAAARPGGEHFASLAPLARRLCEEVEDGGRSAKDAAERIFAALGAADYVPPALGLADPADRFFHNTPARMVRAARWVRTEAPEETAALLKGAMAGLVRERLRSRRRRQGDSTSWSHRQAAR